MGLADDLGGGVGAEPRLVRGVDRGGVAFACGPSRALMPCAVAMPPTISLDPPDQPCAASPSRKVRMVPQISTRSGTML